MQTNAVPTFLSLSKEDQKIALQTLIFSSEEPLNSKQIVNLLNYLEINLSINLETSDNSNNFTSKPYENSNDNQQLIINSNYFDDLINEINVDLFKSNMPFRINFIAGGWQYSILPENGKLINSHFKIKTKKKLTQAALETLAIICYKQPVSKPEIEQIRGVNSNEVVNSLIEKNLIKIAGRSESLGKPLLYATTQEFLRTFGINSIEDLPKLKELEELNLAKPVEQIEIQSDISKLYDINTNESETDDSIENANSILPVYNNN